MMKYILIIENFMQDFPIFSHLCYNFFVILIFLFGFPELAFLLAIMEISNAIMYFSFNKKNAEIQDK